MDFLNWVVTNWDDILKGFLSIVGAASIIVKLTPTLKDDDFLKPIIRLIGKYIALDKYGPKGEVK